MIISNNTSCVSVSINMMCVINIVVIVIGVMCVCESIIMNVNSISNISNVIISICNMIHLIIHIRINMLLI